MNYRTASHPEGACPRCLDPLITHHIEGMRIDACAKCGGVMVDPPFAASMASSAGPSRVIANAIFALVQGKPELVTPRVGEPLKCPQCGIEMQRLQIPSAVCDIDTCVDHGTWFDAHEFHKVARALASARQRKHML